MEYVRNGGNFENEEYDRKDFEKMIIFTANNVIKMIAFI